MAPITCIPNLRELDVVYPVLAHGDNAELRYSLRSVEKNLPHRNVYVYAYTKGIPWLSPKANPRMHTADFVDCPKFYRVNMKLKEICRNPEISDPFILMNDDFFVMKPIVDLPYYALGTLVDRYNSYEVKGSYARDTLETDMLLSDLGIRPGQHYDYEAHTPIVMYKQQLLDTLEKYPESGHRRTLHCVLQHGIVPTFLTKDVKVYEKDERFDENSVFLSTTDESFANRPVGEFIRARFAEPSIYERGEDSLDK